MGLFGVLASLFSCGVYSVSQTQNDIHDRQNRSKAINNNSLTYIDSHGNDRLTSTGEKVCYHGGKYYSLKEPNKVIFDANADYWNKSNEHLIEDAKNRNKKYATLTYPKDNDWNNRYSCKTELKTMKRYQLSFSPYGEKWTWVYFKSYLDSGEIERISLQEFMELGGRPPRMSTDEYFSQSTKEARELQKKIFGGIYE